ncbi:MAG: FixH family protein [Candidatus Thermoplasmatota archaeon]|nr:FixH family protein [Candidatus Thermoplasmatota archaeon]
MSLSTLSSPRALLLTVLLLATGMAGCVSDAGDGLPWASYEEAKAAPGPVFQANGTESPIVLKLLEPSDPDAITEGGLDVIVLLYDEETDEPVTDADFQIEARMPAMGHGTSPETHPVHQRDGIYAGSTTISMAGDWLINLDPQLADGTVLHYDVWASTGGSA